MKAQSLYIHFPFCESKCHYCDFYSLGVDRTKPSDAFDFETALLGECIQNQVHLAEQIDTIFFGGGTPSMTPVESMHRALEPLQLDRRITLQTEWTMEANPSSVQLQSLKDYRKLGINRISMGVQALKPELLKNLGRVHSREAALQALEHIFEAGFKNVSVDLLCGVPGQTEDDLVDALTKLTQFPITHLSCYLLTLPPHHRMYPQLPGEDTQLSHLLLIDKFMESMEFSHYEISNFARPGYEAQHNLNYWKGASYLGLGPSSHSFDAETQTRWKNISSLHSYAERIKNNQTVIEWSEKLTSEQQNIEKWMLALRLKKGFPKSWLTHSHQRTRAHILAENGLLSSYFLDQQEYFYLTPKGFALSDQVIGTLI